MHDLVQRNALRWVERLTCEESNGEQSDLSVSLEVDTEELCDLLFKTQMECGVCSAQTMQSGSEHETPGGGHNRSVQSGHLIDALTLDATFDARNNHRRYIAKSVSAPAESAGRMAAFHRWAREEIEHERGVVDKFAGDAVMATFNISGKEIDHAVHALKAAVALQDRAMAADLPLGVAIATGPAVVGTLTRGSNVSVIGEATNLAARLQSQAARGEIVISTEVYRRVAAWMTQQGLRGSIARFELRGFAEPVTAFRISTFAGGQHTS